MTNTTQTETATESNLITYYVTGHGTFKAPVLVYLSYKHMTRAELIRKLVRIYEGCQAHGGKGDRPTHWRGYAKSDLAIICADCLGAVS